jgi:hypothetical protein
MELVIVFGNSTTGREGSTAVLVGSTTGLVDSATGPEGSTTAFDGSAASLEDATAVASASTSGFGDLLALGKGLATMLGGLTAGSTPFEQPVRPASPLKAEKHAIRMIRWPRIEHLPASRTTPMTASCLANARTIHMSGHCN